MASFTHPLARDAEVWRSHNVEGPSQAVLVIVTTLTLEASHPSFKADKVAKLADAARTWIAATAQAEDFVLINRPREWE